LEKLFFCLLDVFAEKKFTGNQLAVFLNSDTISDHRMQQIANEMHFSETTFILSNHPKNGGYDVKIFTPSNEVPFAGHPTLGTAYVIKQFIVKKETDTVFLNLKVGQIPVKFESEDTEVLWMKQNEPFFGKKFSVSQLAQILQLDDTNFDENFPIQEVSTGLPFVIVPLKTLNAVRNVRVNLSLLQKMAQDFHGGILVFCPEVNNKRNNLNVRVFVDLLGIPEDPATGSGNGCLAGYLSFYRYFGTDEVNIRVEQGYEIQRPSLLLLRAKIIEEKINVQIGGKVILVAQGELLS